MRKIILPLLIVLLISSTKKSKPNLGQNADFRCFEAHEKTYFPGIYGAPTSNTYTLKLIALRKFILKIDSAYAKGRVEKFVIGRKKIQFDSIISLKAKDTIEIYFSFADYPPIPNGISLGQSSKNGSAPYKISPNQALIRYYGGKSKWLIINKITKKEDVFAP